MYKKSRWSPEPPLATYEAACQSMMRFVRKAVEQGPDPEHVARRIMQLATSADPPLRSYVGPRATGYRHGSLSRCVAGFSSESVLQTSTGSRNQSGLDQGRASEPSGEKAEFLQAK
jgi:hypothetical protein